MGTYRTLVHEALACPHCRHVSAYEIQFKYGLCQRLDDVRIGDAIEWDADLRHCHGRPVGGRVEVGGAPLQDCPRCAASVDARVCVEDDVIADVELVAEFRNYGPEDFLQLGGQRAIVERAAVTVRSGFVECPFCRWKSDECIDAREPNRVYCERCGGAITRASWERLRNT